MSNSGLEPLEPVAEQGEYNRTGLNLKIDTVGALRI